MIDYSTMIGKTFVAKAAKNVQYQIVGVVQEHQFGVCAGGVKPGIVVLHNGVQGVVSPEVFDANFEPVTTPETTTETKPAEAGEKKE